MAIIDITGLSYEEALTQIRKTLAMSYLDCGLAYYAYSLHGKNRISTFGHFGEKREIELAGTDIVLRDAMARDFVDDVFLNRICSIPSGEACRFKSMKYLHDYAVDFAHDLGINTTGVPYFTRGRAAEAEGAEQSKPSGGQNTVEAIAARIKMLDDEKRSLMRNLDPMVQAQTLKALAKRMRRAGDIAGGNAKEKEAQDLLDKMKRKADNKLKFIENLKKARAAKADKKRKEEQRAKDRARQQFQPHAGAKARMKKIRERQVERNASKKKASENKEWVNQPIGQVMAKYTKTAL